MQNQKLEKVASFIKKELGIIYSTSNSYQLEARISSIMKDLNLDEASLISKINSNNFSPKEKEHILNISTNNETSFFRDNNVFESFKKSLNKKDVKIWSVAASTGQELVSISIILNELNINGKILGTDISTKALSKAETFQYNQLEISRGLPKEILDKYFEKKDNLWKVKDTISKNITYQVMNLLSSSYPIHEKFDYIFCRNILIYQELESKIKIVEKLKEKLNPDGILILGAGESLIGISDGFKHLPIEKAIFYQKK